MSKNKRDKREEEMKKYAEKEKNFLDASYVPGTLRVVGSYDQWVTWIIKAGSWVRVQLSWGSRRESKQRGRPVRKRTACTVLLGPLSLLCLFVSDFFVSFSITILKNIYFGYA